MYRYLPTSVDLMPFTYVPVSCCRFLYTFQLYLSSEKLYQFGLETRDALQCWVKAIGKV